MQLNKQLIIIVLLASFLISSIATAIYFYKKNKDILKSKSELVTLYIAKDTIPPNTLITAKLLAKTNIERQYVLNEPLVKKEIIGKYTNETIYKHEVFLKQKLDTKLKKEKKKILPYVKSAYNMKFSLFQNPNLALQQGEYINIMSVYPSKDGSEDFNVQYIAPNIKVIGFLRQGKYESETFTKHEVEKVIKKKVVKVVEEIKADEVLLDIDLDTLTNLVRDYNKGRQLWMTKVNYTGEEFKEEKEDKKLLVANIEDVKIEESKKRPEKKKIIKPIKYKYEMYEAKNKVIEKKATIEYGISNESIEKSKSIKLIVDKKIICSNIKDKFIVGNTPKFNIRQEASLSSNIVNSAKKNTIIPYIMKTDEFYKICDGSFVHRSVVKEISPELVKSKLGKYE